ncbi:GNAT family N-acetyltransferase [Sinomonas sp. P10A9]|uniref:N-acetyltransferase family protein n=1 Tax=Sinomonas puerhi TaxID=3238584 RepID=A0AB39L2G7_9MICC
MPGTRLTSTGDAEGWLVRPAAPRDLPAINAVSRAAGRPEWDPTAVAPASDRCAVVALATGVLVGAAKTHRYPLADGDAPAGHYLGGIVVHPDARRRGAGRALTAARLAWIWELADVAYYIANARNAASIALHAGFGFSPIAAGPQFHGVTFDGGRGLVLAARRTDSARQRGSALET